MRQNFYEKYTVKTDSPADVPTLEITTKIGCAVNCRYCPQSLLVEKYSARSSKREMTFDTFKQCVDKLPTNAIVCFAGFSEPFLSPAAVDMIKYAAAQREVSLFTTLVGLSIKGFEEIRCIPFRKVVLHLPDEKNFANIPVTKNYLELLNVVLQTKKPNGDFFVDKIICQAPPKKSILPLIVGQFHVSWNMTNRSGNLSCSELAVIENFEGALTCRLSNHNHNVLLPNGDVVLCSMDFGLKHTLGNLLCDDYYTLMSSPTMSFIKTATKNAASNLLCRTCSEAVRI